MLAYWAVSSEVWKLQVNVARCTLSATFRTVGAVGTSALGPVHPSVRPSDRSSLGMLPDFEPGLHVLNSALDTPHLSRKGLDSLTV